MAVPIGNGAECADVRLQTTFGTCSLYLNARSHKTFSLSSSRLSNTRFHVWFLNWLWYPAILHDSSLNVGQSVSWL